MLQRSAQKNTEHSGVDVLFGISLFVLLSFIYLSDLQNINSAATICSDYRM